MKHFTSFMFLIVKWVFPVALVLIAIQDFLHTEWLKITYWFDWSAQLNIMTGGVLVSWTDMVVSLVWMFLISMAFCAAFFVMNQQLESEFTAFSAFLKKNILFVMISLLIPLSVILYLPWQFHVFSIFLIPFTLFMAPSAALYPGKKKTERMKKGFRYSSSSYGKLFLLLFVLGFFLFLFLQPLGFVFSIHETNEAPLMRDLLDVLVDFVTRSVVWFTDDALIVGNIIRQLVYLSVLMLLIPFIALIFGFGFLTEVEIKEVISLKKAFEKFGSTVKNKEYQSE